MPTFHNTHTKKKAKEKGNNIIHVALNYFIISSSFWVLLSLFFYFYLYDPSYGTFSKLKITSSISLFGSSILVILLTLVFSIIIGIVLSLPSIILKFLFLFKLTRRRLRGQKPVILIFFTKYIPLIVLYAVNILFLLFNFSISPEMMSDFLSSKNFLVVLSKKINYLVFKKNPDYYYDYGKKIGSKFPKNSTYIFLLPDNIMNDPQNFIKTKILLKNTSQILITNSFKSNTISSIFNFYPSAYYKLYTPVPFAPSTSFQDLKKRPLHSVQSSRKSELALNNKLIYIGVDVENSYNFYSLFNSFARIEEIKLNWFNIFLNKFAFSQPQLLYFFKSGFAQHFSALWKWPNIYNSNPTLLMKYSQDLIKGKNNNYNKFLFYLSGLDENGQKKLLNQYNEINITKTNLKKELKKEDLYLAQFIGGLLINKNNNIILLPYISKTKQIDLYNFYSNITLDKKIYITNNILTQKDERKNHCYIKTSYFNNENYEQIFINKLDYNKGPIYFDKKYEFFIKNKINESFVCYLDDDNIYYITRNYENFKANNFNYGESFSKIFEEYAENKSYLKRNKTKYKISIEKSQELFQNEFFNQFQIYKINNNSQKITILQNNQEKELLFKNYGGAIINEMYDYANR